MSDQQGAGGPTGVDPGSVVPEAVVRPASSAGDPPDDAALLAAHVAGDPDAFGELVRRHRDRLWAVGVRTTRRPRGGVRRPPGRPGLRLPRRRVLPRRRGRHDLAAPHRGQRLPRPDAPPEGATDGPAAAGGRRDGVAAWLDPRETSTGSSCGWRSTSRCARCPTTSARPLVLVDIEGLSGGRGGRAPRHPRGHGEEPVLARTGPPGGRAARGCGTPTRPPTSHQGQHRSIGRPEAGRATTDQDHRR